jgi:hypothetical protein
VPSARADVTITEKVSQEFAGGGAKFIQVERIRGLSLRVEDGAGAEVWIYDAAGGSITRLDARQHEAHTYDAALAAADAEREVPSNPAGSQLVATGRTKLLRGRVLSEYRFSTRAPLGAAAAEAVLVKGSVWIAFDGAGLLEYLAFHRSAAARGLIFSDAGARDQGDGRLALAFVRARTELDRRIAAVGGMPWVVDLSVKPEKPTVLAPLDLRLRGRSRTTTIAMTTDAIPSDAFAVPSDWQTVHDEESGLYQQVRSDPDAGRIRLLGRRLWLGVGTGISALRSGAARDAFGRASWQPVIRLVGPLATAGLGLSVAPVFRRYSTQSASARVLAPTAGLGVRLAQPRKDLVPFVAWRAGPYLISLRGSDTRLRPGGTVEGGVSYRRRLVLSGSYELLARAKGVDLSNWSLNAVVRIY